MIRLVRKAVVVMCAAAAAGSALTGVQAAPPAQAAPKSVWDGVYTEAQARRGEQAYKSNCSYCHKDDLRGGFEDSIGRAPALAGERAFDSSFSERWGGSTMAEMVGTIASVMPQDKPGTLAVETYLDIVSFLLLKNNVPAGNEELPADIDVLNRIIIRAK